MTNSVSFELAPGQTLSIIQSGPNTATLTKPGETYSLGNIVVGPGSIDCDVLGPFGLVEAKIAVTWSADDLTITVSEAWEADDDGVTTYSVKASDIAALDGFIKSAGFPSA